MNQKLKIGVNGRFFTKQFTGIGRYSLNIFSELARLYPEFEFYIGITEKLDPEADRNLRYQDNLHFEIIRENSLFKSLHPGLAKSYWERVQLNRFFRESEVDLIHLPYPSLYKPISDIPVIITVHDTIPWTELAYAKRNFLSGAYNRATLMQTKEADFLLTVSEFSKKEILKLLNISENRLAVIYNACEFNEVPDFSKEDVAACMEKFELDQDDKYLFYMGGYDRRKNVQRVIKIFSELIAPVTDYKLVLGGGNVLGHNLFDSLGRIAGSEGIIRTGFLSNHDLIILYRKAMAYFSLTTIEGFNLPLLEALTLGCPALVSDLPVHREIADSTPFFLNLNDSDEVIAEKILTLLENKAEYNRLRQKTDDFAEMAREKFSWGNSAKSIGQIYLKLCGK